MACLFAIVVSWAQPPQHLPLPLLSPLPKLHHLRQLGRFLMARPVEVTALASSIDKDSPEISSHDSPANFSSRVNLVMVPVIVRDGRGRAIGNLTQSDFQLFDKGKPQTISRFSVENAAEKAANQAARMKEATRGVGEDLARDFRPGSSPTFSMTRIWTAAI